jgi:nitroreductase
MRATFMDALEAIATRRSIRQYTEQPIPVMMIDKLLAAAMSAPSAGNEQPWHFVMVTDRPTLNEIPKFHHYSHMLKTAPLAILVCGEPTREKHQGFWVEDCSAATENLLIAAHALGLGAVWLGVYPNEEIVTRIRSLLGMPEHIIPFALVSLGFPAESKPPANCYDATRIHRNRW